jgi:chorismate mutase
VRSNPLGLPRVFGFAMGACPSAPPTLASVRRDLEQIDRAIVLLVAARIDAACSAIRLRAQSDGQVANPAQEGRVIARAQGWAEQLGVSPELAEKVFRAIIEAGKARYTTMRKAAGTPSRRSAARSARPRALARRAGAA